MQELQILKNSIFDSHPKLMLPKSFLPERLQQWYRDIMNDEARIRQLAEELGLVDIDNLKPV